MARGGDRNLLRKDGAGAPSWEKTDYEKRQRWDTEVLSPRSKPSTDTTAAQTHLKPTDELPAGRTCRQDPWRGPGGMGTCTGTGKIAAHASVM